LVSRSTVDLFYDGSTSLIDYTKSYCDSAEIIKITAMSALAMSAALSMWFLLYIDLVSANIVPNKV
jgi:hypothetical protein